MWSLLVLKSSDIQSVEFGKVSACVILAQMWASRGLLFIGIDENIGTTLVYWRSDIVLI